MKKYDAVIIGGGPAGSSCARKLVEAGVDVVVLDGTTFPRVKLCAGWVSPPIWDLLELAPQDYPRGLWEWHKGIVHFRGGRYTLAQRGYFIRRYELDDFLLRRSKAPVVEGHHVKTIERASDGSWLIDGQFQATYLIGAGGNNCPVARALFPEREPPCGTQEREFEADAADIAACRAGLDGEPEVLLHDDLAGYSWNVPKTGWLNIGAATTVARAVLPAWRNARAFFEGNGGSGTVPVSARPSLDKMKGHGYSGFTPRHLSSCFADNAFLIGDSLGLAHPTTGEGILPAVLSGNMCASAIADGAPATYRTRLETHPIIRDYRVLFQCRAWAGKLLKREGAGRIQQSRLYARVVATLFGSQFGGKLLPGNRLIGRVMELQRRAAEQRAEQPR
jgi:menaquinone-9 beta-reductase